MNLAGLPYQGETQVIGAVLRNKNLYHKISWLEPENFSQGLNSRVWQAIKDCVSRGMEIDRMVLNGIDPGISPTYLELAMQTGKDQNVEAEAKIILDRWKLTQVAYMATDIKTGLANGARAHPEVFLDQLSERFEEINVCNDVEAEITADKVLERAVEAIFNEDECLDIPWPNVYDMALVRPSDVVVLGARPSCGKTSLALNWMLHLAKQGIPCCFHSLETSKALLGKRLISIDAQVDIGRNPGTTIQREIEKSKERLKRLPFYIYDSLFTVSEILNTSRAMNQRHDVKVFFVDYLQLIKSRHDDPANTNYIIGDISRQFKQFALKEGVIIVMLCQLNRNVEHRTSGRPKLADLRDSGTIEQDASHVWLLYRKGEDEHTPKNTTGFIIAKQKDGPTGELNLNFQMETYTFREHAPNYEEWD